MLICRGDEHLVRVLIANHLPLDHPAAGMCSADLAARLLTAGHHVRAVVVDGSARPTRVDSVPTRRVVCDSHDAAAELPFSAPRFGDSAGAGPRFADLSDSQFAAYREALRLTLDAEVAAFDPHIIHCEHIWLLGHLALEAGVPYVLTGDAAELIEFETDVRYRRTATEAAENAGRIIVADTELGDSVRTLFGDLEDRIVTVPRPAGTDPHNKAEIDVGWLADLYRQVVDDRWGPHTA